jgi:two-component system, cell cycle response regulator
LLAAWGLPDLLRDAVGAHHGQGLATLAGQSRDLAKLVHVAATLADLFCQEIPSTGLERIVQECSAATGLARHNLDAMLASLTAHVRDMAGLLALQISQTVDYAQLQAQAATQLAQLSVQAEVERLQSSQREHAARSEAERLHEEKQAILEVASTDGLTKVANRAAFDRRLEEELGRARERGTTLALIMLDVDFFKRFNDTYGHLAGDAALRAVGSCLRDAVRDLGVIARYGGEEFAVILADLAAADVRRLAEQIRHAIASTIIEHDGEPLRVTASLGATMVQPALGDATPASLIAEADQYLYQAKRNGRNRVEFAARLPSARPIPAVREPGPRSNFTGA